MADNIVDSLFGPQPWQVQQQQNAGLQQFAAQQANRDPLQMAKYGLTMGGGMLAGAGMEAAGYANPAVVQAQMNEQNMAGLDPSDPKSLLLRASQIQDPRMKWKLMLAARDMEKENAKRRLDEAHAEYYKMGGANKGRYSPENIAALSDKERASKLMVARNTATMMTKDMNFPSEEARVAWVDREVESADAAYLRANPLAGKSASNPQVVPQAAVPQIPQPAAPQAPMPISASNETPTQLSPMSQIASPEGSMSPQMLQAIRADMQSRGDTQGLTTLPTSQRPFAPTMTQSVEAKARAKSTGENDPAVLKPAAVAKAAGKEEGEAAGKANIALSGFDDTKMLVQAQLAELLRHPGFESTVGATWKPGFRFIPGTQEASFMKRMDQIKGGSFLKAYETLKGGGQITEIEGQKATDAINRMDISTNEKEFRAAAKDFLDAITVGFNKLKAQSKLGNVKPPETAKEDPLGLRK